MLYNLQVRVEADNTTIRAALRKRFGRARRKRGACLNLNGVQRLGSMRITG
jgi:hypothetical protein